MSGTLQHFTVLRGHERDIVWQSVVDVVSRELLFRNAEVRMIGAGLDIAVAGTTVRLAQRAERAGIIDDGLAPIRAWEPSAALGAHAAHVTMEVKPRDASELAALLATKVGLTLTAAIGEACGDVLAVHARPSDAFLPPDMVEAVLAAFAAGAVPAEMLVQYAPYHPQNAGLRGTVGIISKGLMPFAGFEVAVAPTRDGDSTEVLHCAVQAVRRQLVEGAPLRDGDTIATMAGPVHVRLVSEWLIPGVAMAVLLPQGALVDRETLCVAADVTELAANDAAPVGVPRRRSELMRRLAKGLFGDKEAGDLGDDRTA